MQRKGSNKLQEPWVEDIAKATSSPTAPGPRICSTRALGHLGWVWMVTWRGPPCPLYTAMMGVGAESVGGEGRRVCRRVRDRK